MHARMNGWHHRGISTLGALHRRILGTGPPGPNIAVVASGADERESALSAIYNSACRGHMTSPKTQRRHPVEEASLFIASLALVVAILSFWRTALIQDQAYAREISSRHTEFTLAVEEVARLSSRARAIYNSFWALARTYDPSIPQKFPKDEKQFDGLLSATKAALESQRLRSSGADPLEEEQKLREIQNTLLNARATCDSLSSDLATLQSVCTAVKPGEDQAGAIVRRLIANMGRMQ